ncbi:multicopper oxidase family protein [Streptomyces sp. TLI_171]|uniref:multicopper oxidase family protein n=1 Tax=Streptomyces sp. TLI_171 TaxID=1938859 RepID=UPI000C1A1B12|nr:multicopper oxidase domain-containing protein [Streptomyces sp. TLI_171]RKE17011.1 FtsP/CotA-like multicopper oxidase with cupredoxin domain [Streptomyces sp. TLI_171]
MGEQDGIGRRLLLKAVAGLAAAPAGLRTARSAAAAEPPGFPQPAVTAARPLTGVLPGGLPGAPPRVVEQTLDVRFTEVAVPGHGVITTRTYNGTIPGPTLRVRAGDTLRLTHVNGLPPNEPHRGGHNTPHHANSFNLHTHGMHVSPSGHADNVLREFAPRTSEQVAAGAPEPRYTTTVRIPADHPAGTYWYHPHLHGATAEQILGGMAGVIVVEGDVDELPQLRAAADLVVCINELKLKDGKVPPFTSGGWVTGIPSVFTVNGAVNPTLPLRPGEVARLRLVAATGLTALGLRITGEHGDLTMHQIAQDGVTFARPVAPDVLELAMGNRADVLIRGGAPGSYQLRARGVPGPLMTVEVAGPPVEPPMELPTALPPGKPFLDENDITDPSADREVVFHADPRVFPEPFPNAFRILGSHPTPAADPAGDPAHDPAYGLFDPGFTNHTLRLGTVERWTVRTDETMPAFNHPFHLHTNQFLLTHRNGTRLHPPVWHDTIGLPGGTPGDSVTFLVKYEDFTGHTIAHCHQLHHEDLGMMQTVHYTAP